MLLDINKDGIACPPIGGQPSRRVPKPIYNMIAVSEARSMQRVRAQIAERGGNTVSFRHIKRALHIQISTRLSQFLTFCEGQGIDINASSDVLDEDTHRALRTASSTLADSALASLI